MQYIVHRRFRHTSACGSVNIPAMSECESIGNVIYYNGKQICSVFSRNAHQFFARNDDCNGMLRGKLTSSIKAALEKKDAKHDERCEKVENDSICQRYRRQDCDDTWLWNHDFYNADVDVLRYIANLIGVKEGK